MRHVYFQAPLIKSHARCYPRTLTPYPRFYLSSFLALCESERVRGEIITQRDEGRGGDEEGKVRQLYSNYPRPNLISIHGVYGGRLDRGRTSLAGRSGIIARLSRREWSPRVRPRTLLLREKKKEKEKMCRQCMNGRELLFFIRHIFLPCSAVPDVGNLAC